VNRGIVCSADGVHDTKPADFVNTVGWLVTKYLGFTGLLHKSHIDNPTIIFAGHRLVLRFFAGSVFNEKRQSGINLVQSDWKSVFSKVYREENVHSQPNRLNSTTTILSVAVLYMIY
jgi:hypothetical protein